MKCMICGAEFRPTSAGGSPQKYCSAKCRNKAKVVARHARAKAGAAPAGESERRAEPMASVESQPLTRLEFHKMMDDSMEDVLRLNRDVLSKALTSPDTPANALAAISRQLLAVTERLDQLEGGDPLLGIDPGDEEPQNLTQEDADGAGKAVV